MNIKPVNMENIAHRLRELVIAGEYFTAYDELFHP